MGWLECVGNCPFPEVHGVRSFYLSYTVMGTVYCPNYVVFLTAYCFKYIVLRTVHCLRYISFSWRFRWWLFSHIQGTDSYYTDKFGILQIPFFANLRNNCHRPQFTDNLNPSASSSYGNKSGGLTDIISQYAFILHIAKRTQKWDATGLNYLLQR